MPASAPQTSFTFVLNPEQREILELLLRDGNYRPKEVPYTIVAVEAPSWKCNVNLYTSGMISYEEFISKSRDPDTQLEKIKELSGQK